MVKVALLRNVLGYVTSKPGFLALPKIPYSCRLEQGNIQKQRERQEIQKNAKRLIISKMENIILNLYMQHLISFAPNSREP